MELDSILCSSKRGFSPSFVAFFRPTLLFTPRKIETGAIPLTFFVSPPACIRSRGTARVFVNATGCRVFDAEEGVLDTAMPSWSPRVMARANDLVGSWGKTQSPAEGIRFVFFPLITAPRFSNALTDVFEGAKILGGGMEARCSGNVAEELDTLLVNREGRPVDILLYLSLFRSRSASKADVGLDPGPGSE